MTIDETWVHHFTPEAKEQSKQWTEMEESVPKNAKTVPFIDKVMESVFWDTREIIFIDLQQKKTIMRTYCNV
jgi:hypothetical protein